jgi:Kef-type K+ transport system membrane component KefB
VASAGKFGGTFLAARLTGSGWREAVSLGILMNTRGLMELVAMATDLAEFLGAAVGFQLLLGIPLIAGGFLSRMPIGRLAPRPSPQMPACSGAAAAVIFSSLLSWRTEVPNLYAAPKASGKLRPLSVSRSCRSKPVDRYRKVRS